MSGRGAKHTGGTVDKLEAIPGYQTSIRTDQVYRDCKTPWAQCDRTVGHLAPADKKSTHSEMSRLAGGEHTLDSCIDQQAKSWRPAVTVSLLDVRSGSGCIYEECRRSPTPLAQKKSAIG